MSNLEICNFDQGTKEWFEARAGRITGTRLHDVIPTLGANGKETQKSIDKRKGLMYTMIYEKIAPLQDMYTGSGAMERGHLIEEVAKELYKEEITSVGFLRRTDNEYLGISPDGLIIEHFGETSQGHEIIIRKAIEIKGPLGKTFIKYWLDPFIPDEYYWQVIHYFVVIDTLETLDFVIHDPAPYDLRTRTKIITVTRAELLPDIQRAEVAIIEFTLEFAKLIALFVETVKKESE